MLPFSVLRSFFLFIFSWVILGLGIYCAYLAYQSFQHSTDQARVIRVPVDAGNAVDGDLPVGNTVDGNDLATSNPSLEQTVTQQPANDLDWYRWSLLAGAILCLGISCGGRLPARLVMKSVRTDNSQIPQPSSSFEVVRPDGSCLRGHVFGDEQKPTLLLTHGWSLDSSAWKYMVPYLLAKYRIVTWDLPGLGKSVGPKNNDFSLEKMADDLHSVLERVSPNGPAILVGHSIGGMIQQTFCRLHHAKLGSSVKGIVVVQTTYTNPLNTNALAALVKPLEPLIAVMNWAMVPLSPLMWLSNWQSYYNGSAHWAARLESFTGKQTWQQLDHSARLGAAAWPAVLARGNLGMMKFNEEATLPKIPVPLLIISGSHDRLTVQSASRHIEQLVPKPTSSSHDGGHLGHWEHTAVVSQTIVNFADSTLRSTAR